MSGDINPVFIYHIKTPDLFSGVFMWCRGRDSSSPVVRGNDQNLTPPSESGSSNTCHRHLLAVPFESLSPQLITTHVSACVVYGAAGETRTLILLRGPAPKAGVSTNFTTAALCVLPPFEILLISRFFWLYALNYE